MSSIRNRERWRAFVSLLVSSGFLLGTLPSLFLIVESRPLTLPEPSKHCSSFNVVLLFSVTSWLSHRCTLGIKRKIRFPWHRIDPYQQHASVVAWNISRKTCGSSSDPIRHNITVGSRKNGGGRREDPASLCCGASLSDTKARSAWCVCRPRTKAQLCLVCFCRRNQVCKVCLNIFYIVLKPMFQSSH